MVLENTRINQSKFIQSRLHENAPNNMSAKGFHKKTSYKHTLLV